jgi:hypothetical protein
MNDSDRAALQEFLAKLKIARLPEKDPEASRMIDEVFQVQPDAAQLLVIKSLLQQRALDEMRAQIEDLQQELAQLQSQAATAPAQESSQDRGWFSRLMGAPARRPQASAPPPPAYSQGYSQGYAAPAYGAGPMQAPGGSFLGSIATTAAGVAAGEFLFEGIEHMLHGGRGYGGYGYAPSGFMEGQPVVENVTINEYGNDHGGGHEYQRAVDSRDTGSGFQNVDDPIDNSGDFDSGSFDDSFSGNDDISV